MTKDAPIFLNVCQPKDWMHDQHCNFTRRQLTFRSLYEKKPMANMTAMLSARMEISVLRRGPQYVESRFAPHGPLVTSMLKSERKASVSWSW